MTSTFINQLPTNFSPNSRVWIFQCNRPLRQQEVIEINEQLFNFYTQWQSHGTAVKGWAECFFAQFIIVIANEEQTSIGGCSTDGLMRTIKSFEKQYSIELFDRLTITFLKNNKVEPLPYSQIAYALEKGLLQPDTLVFNNLVNTKHKLETEWILPLNKSWLWSKVSAEKI